MPNEYFSQERQIVARGHYSAVLAPPADVVIPAGDMATRAFIINHNNINRDSNIIIKRLGLFCNFADGLVIKNPATEPHSFRLLSYAYGPKGSNEPGTVSISPGSTTVTGVGTSFTALAAGDAFAVDGSDAFIYRIDSITNDTTLILKDIPIAEFTAENFGVCPLLGSRTIESGTEIDVLNEMIPLDEVIVLPTFVSYTDTVQFVVIEIEFGDEGVPWSFLTKSIAADFAGDSAVFNTHMDVQLTGVA